MKLTAKIQQRRENRRRALPVHCISCRNDGIRYVYTWNYKGRTYLSDTYCQACGKVTHDFDGDPVVEQPVIDYGSDVARTLGQVEDETSGTVTPTRKGKP